MLRRDVRGPPGSEAVVVFFADRTNLQVRRLHRRILESIDWGFHSRRLTIAGPRDPGLYRVVGETDPRVFFDVDSYPVEDARVEIGFRLADADDAADYWLTYVEPDRDLSVGWHRHPGHMELGAVHLQLAYGDEVVTRRPVEVVDAHPLYVVDVRLRSLPDMVDGVRWSDGRPTGFEDSIG